MNLSPLRQFWAGVCAIPKPSDSGTPFDLEYWRNKADKLSVTLERFRGESDSFQQQLTAEREAHAADNIRHALQFEGECAEHSNDNERHANARVQLGDKIEELNEQLSAARADLEALTRWVPGDKSPLMDKTRVAVSDCDDYSDAIIVESTDAYMYRFCRPIPESLAAWKAREGEGDATE